MEIPIHENTNINLAPKDGYIFWFFNLLITFLFSTTHLLHD